MFPALLFSEEALTGFFQRVALARAIGVTTNFRWESVNNSTLNALYGLKYVLTLGNAAGPGYVQTQGASGAELRRIAEQQMPGLKKTFAEKARMGPDHLVPWLEKLEKERQRHITDMQKLQLEARKTNEEVDRLVNEAIFYIASIKFASELALATLGMMPFGGVGGVFLRLGIGLGYPVFLSLLDIANGKQASIVSSLSTVAATGAKAVGDNAASFTGEGQGPIMKGVEAGTVDKHKKEIADLKALRKKHGNLSKKNQVKLRTERARVRVAKANLNVLGTIAGGISVWFYYKSCEDSAAAYWEALEGM